MTTDEDLLADLERRVSLLERRAQTGPAEVGPEAARSANADAEQAPGAAAADAFWALEGLRAREPAPGAVMIVGDVTLPDGAAAWQEGALAQDLIDDEWDRAADALAALGHPVRLRVLREVLRGHSTARQLAELDGLGTTGQVYHHLRQLTATGWLRARPGGRHEVPAERLVPLLTTVLGARR